MEIGRGYLPAGWGEPKSSNCSSFSEPLRAALAGAGEAEGTSKGVETVDEVEEEAEAAAGAGAEEKEAEVEGPDAARMRFTLSKIVPSEG